MGINIAAYRLKINPDGYAPESERLTPREWDWIRYAGDRSISDWMQEAGVEVLQVRAHHDVYVDHTHYWRPKDLDAFLEMLENKTGVELPNKERWRSIVELMRDDNTIYFENHY